ncbi:MAG TPA: hypothetical protein P5526_10555 [Anaerolineae bacterium]|nr:hypothetical protein [Anaerolineae bacterium]MCB0222834.1 hypothetical protein [Anaerolineae bacterium]HRV92592.1 hypothetical protein [Anaerolineae bacterium]
MLAHPLLFWREPGPCYNLTKFVISQQIHARDRSKVWSLIKKTGSDIWDEMFKLMVFNIIWVLATLIVLPWPFVTFGLFYTVKDIGEGNGIKFSSPFTYGLQVLKPAYIWAIINLGVFLGIFLNLNFYSTVEASWARFIQIFMLSLMLFWIIIQLVMLAMYPRLTEPSFRLALRNSVIIIARHPGPILALSVGVVLILIISSFIPVLLLLLSISMIMMLVNNVIDSLVTYELDHEKIRRN